MRKKEIGKETVPRWYLFLSSAVDRWAVAERISASVPSLSKDRGRGRDDPKAEEGGAGGVGWPALPAVVVAREDEGKEG